MTFAGRHHDNRVATGGTRPGNSSRHVRWGDRPRPRPSVWCAAPPGVQEALVGSDPHRFFRPPYVGGRGWLGVYLDVPGVDWAEIAEIVADAYREVTPKHRGRAARRAAGAARSVAFDG